MASPAAPSNLPPPAVSLDEAALIQAFYERILEALPAQLAVFSPTGQYEYVTPSAIADPAVRQWIVGKNDVEYAAKRGLPPDVPARRLEAIRAVARDGQPFTFEESFANKQGELRTFQRFVAPVSDANGNVQHVIGYGLDVTDLRRTEEQLRHAQKMEAVGRLAGGVAHDFNNLITIIAGFADLLQRSLDEKDERLEAVLAIREASERASGLTRQLLSFSRRAPLEVSTLDANAAVRDTIQLLERLIGEHVQVVLDLHCPHPWIRADVGQFKQILLNLVLNARDAMPNGGELAISTHRVDFDRATATSRESPAGGFLEVRISDTGIGMSPEILARVFEPFFTTKAPDKGTGLGLSTVYGIVTQLDGHLLAESVAGTGSTFRALLPLVPPPAAATAADAPATIAPPRPGTVLVAEDEERVRQLVARILRAVGHDVLLAGSGTEALQVVQRHPGVIDVLVTDVVMPDFGGRRLADAARMVRPTLRVLYVSGYADEERLTEDANPADAFLDKPFTMDSLQAAVQALIDQARAG